MHFMRRARATTTLPGVQAPGARAEGASNRGECGAPDSRLPLRAERAICEGAVRLGCSWPGAPILMGGVVQ